MLQVIGEIGGTSSRWAVLSDEGPATVWPLKGERLPGFNPVSGDGAAYARAVRSWFVERQPEALEARAIHIYGAGCGAAVRKERMAQAIGAVWPAAMIHVHSDLTGAALGLCGKGSGLVLILGTGMNAGHFDGQRLHTPMPSLGYLLGDEASGADIGRHLLQDVFYGRVPQDLAERLFGPEGPVLPTVLEKVHGAAHPARELAAYTALLAPHLHEPYVRELLQGRFHELAELLTRFFTPEQLRSVYATGSVAYGFRELLAECLLDRGMSIIAVEPDPLPGLVRHHQQQGRSALPPP